MNTALLLMARYDARPIIPLETVRADFFAHIDSRQKFIAKLNAKLIDLPVVRLDPSSQKSALGVNLTDLAAYIDRHSALGRKEHEKLMQAAG